MMAAAAPGPRFWLNKWVVINLLLLLLLLSHSVWRDIRMEEGYFGEDLRNRVVGARLQKDGILPYFFHWEINGELRYADPESPGETGPNAITASPFFHQLMMPVCEWPQLTICRFWLLFTWLLLISITVVIFTFAGSDPRRLAVINLAAVFTLTEGWKMNIIAGQLYLFNAFLMTGFLFFVLRAKKLDWLPGGLLAAMLILCRPIALVVGLPFLPRLKTYRLYLAAAVLFLGVYAVFVYTRPFERAVWAEYRQAMAAHVASHQSTVEYTPPTRERRTLRMLEGIDLEANDKKASPKGRLFFSENGNVFVLYESLFHRHLPLGVLNGLSLLVIVLLEALWIYRSRSGSIAPWQLAVLGWTFYMIIELFNPVHRHQYNSVQWLPVVLTMTVFLDWRRRPVTLLLMIMGLFLNICNFPWLLMRHTLGEFCWVAAGLSVLFSENQKPVTWKLP